MTARALQVFQPSLTLKFLYHVTGKQERNLEDDHQHDHLHPHRHRNNVRNDELHVKSKQAKQDGQPCPARGIRIIA
jgi:hypothetical protein